jgi:hypothetical protein
MVLKLVLVTHPAISAKVATIVTTIICWNISFHEKLPGTDDVVEAAAVVGVGTASS